MKNPYRPLGPAEISWVIEDKIRNGPHVKEDQLSKKSEPWPWPKSTKPSRKSKKKST